MCEGKSHPWTKIKEFLRKHGAWASVISAVAIYYLSAYSIEPYRRTVQSLWRFFVALLTVGLFGLFLGENGFRRVFSLKGFRRAWIPIGISLLFPLAALINLVVSLQYTAVPNRGEGFWELMTSEIYRTPMLAFYEEVISRGLLFTVPMQRWGKKPWQRLLLILVGSLWFGSGHPMNQIVQAAVHGLILTAVYLYSGNLLASTLAHSLINYLAILQQYYYYSPDVLPDSMQFTYSLATFAIFTLTSLGAVYYILKAPGSGVTQFAPSPRGKTEGLPLAKVILAVGGGVILCVICTLFLFKGRGIFGELNDLRNWMVLLLCGVAALTLFWKTQGKEVAKKLFSPRGLGAAILPVAGLMAYFALSCVEIVLQSPRGLGVLWATLQQVVEQIPLAFGGSCLFFVLLGGTCLRQWGSSPARRVWLALGVSLLYGGLTSSWEYGTVIYASLLDAAAVGLTLCAIYAASKNLWAVLAATILWLWIDAINAWPVAVNLPALLTLATEAAQCILVPVFAGYFLILGAKQGTYNKHIRGEIENDEKTPDTHGQSLSS